MVSLVLESTLLILATFIFYVVFASLIYYWKETYVTVLILPLIYTFQFFLFGFAVIIIFNGIQYVVPLVISFVSSW